MVSRMRSRRVRIVEGVSGPACVFARYDGLFASVSKRWEASVCIRGAANDAVSDLLTVRICSMWFAVSLGRSPPFIFGASGQRMSVLLRNGSNVVFLKAREPQAGFLASAFHLKPTKVGFPPKV